MFDKLHIFFSQLLNILSEGGVAPEDLVLELIIARLNSPDIDHYGIFCNTVLSKTTNSIIAQQTDNTPEDLILSILYVIQQDTSSAACRSCQKNARRYRSRLMWLKTSDYHLISSLTSKYDTHLLHLVTEQLFYSVHFKMKSGYSDKSGMMGNIVTIFQQCADKDLVNRLSGVKQCPKTGRLYTRDQWNPQELLRGKGKNYEEEEDRKEQVRLCRFLMFMVCCLCLLCCICSGFFFQFHPYHFPHTFYISYWIEF